MIYNVMKIEEDLDYGCEEKSEDQPVMAVVTLRSAEGEESICRIPDSYLYDNEITEGDRVIFNEENLLQKPLGEDWTTYCSSKNTDTEGFAEWLQAARGGREVRRICPFCGGHVAVISNENEHTLIGCDSCDMRISLDVKHSNWTSTPFRK